MRLLQTISLSGVNDTTSLPDGVFPANKNPALPYYEGTTIDTFYAHGFPDFQNVKSPVKVYDVGYCRYNAEK